MATGLQLEGPGVKRGAPLLAGVLMLCVVEYNDLGLRLSVGSLGLLIQTSRKATAGVYYKSI